MRETLRELEVPKGMSVILRTAGVSRTKTEIKRDTDYLMRLWNDIRELTLESSAPALIYEEADLIKRAVRDLYTRDVDEILVSGDEGYKNTKKFMKMMIPSHAKRVKQYKDDRTPLFHKYGVEKQITEIGETTARLKSGGYLVINPTEALVSIDVNSGRATKERHIEETALNTNMEAAEEGARQLKLRDLGGLVVVDFIDMEDRRNNAKVERKLKEALSSDRARIQLGRISSFGLLEMSRQRLNPSLTEAQFEPCEHCKGRGVVRTCDATVIMLLRSLEEEGIKNRAAELIVHMSSSVALYILNYKRDNLKEIEARYGFTVLIRTDESMTADDYRIEVSKPSEGYAPNDKNSDDDEDDSDNRNQNKGRNQSNKNSKSNDQDEDNDNDDDDDGNRKGRRRGRRGGRNRRGRDRNRSDSNDNQNDGESQNDHSDKEDKVEAVAQDQADEAEKPKSGRKTAAQKTSKKSSDEVSADVDADTKEQNEKPKKKAPARSRKKAESKDADKTADVNDAAEDKAQDEKPKKKAPARKTAAKKSEEKKAEPKEAAKVDVADASNDDAKSAKKAEAKPASKAEAKPKDDTPKDYETVNEAPKKKKKGWWNL